MFAAASSTTGLGRSLLQLSDKWCGHELRTHFPSSSLRCPTIIPTCISRVCSRSLNASSFMSFWAFARATTTLPCCKSVAMSFRVIWACDSILSCSCPRRCAVKRNWDCTAELSFQQWSNVLRQRAYLHLGSFPARHDGGRQKLCYVSESLRPSVESLMWPL